jgi:hypothetical protein
MERVPDTRTDLILPPTHPSAIWVGTCSVTRAIPGNDPVALPSSTLVGVMPPWGHALACHPIGPERLAPVCDEEKQLNGLEENNPRRWPEKDRDRTIEELAEQSESVAVTREVFVPPPEGESGGEKRTTPESAQATDPSLLPAADAVWDVNTSTPATIIRPSSLTDATLFTNLRPTEFVYMGPWPTRCSQNWQLCPSVLRQTTIPRARTHALRERPLVAAVKRVHPLFTAEVTVFASRSHPDALRGYGAPWLDRVQSIRRDSPGSGWY